MYIVLFFDNRKTLDSIFKMCDLDDNGRLSRDEFSLFQLVTNEEEVDDDTWEVVQS